MTKLIRNSILFVVSLTVTYLCIFGFLWMVRINKVPAIYHATKGNVWKGGPTYVKFREFDAGKKWDVLVIGSSHALNGYDPEVFKQHGLSMYNFGSSNQNMVCSYNIAKHYVNRDNCRLVILDVFDRVFSTNYIESVSDFIQNISSDKAALDIAVGAQDLYTVNMFTLRMFNKFAEPNYFDTAGHVNGYHVFRRYLDPKNINEKLSKWEYKRTDLQLKYLDCTLGELRKKGIPVIVAQHPTPVIYKLAKHDEFRKDILPILEKHDVPWFDYNEAAGFENIRYFADPTHLNHLGVPKYNNLLLKDLRSAGILRQDASGQYSINTTKHFYYE